MVRCPHCGGKPDYVGLNVIECGCQKEKCDKDNNDIVIHKCLKFVPSSEAYQGLAIIGEYQDDVSQSSSVTVEWQSPGIFVIPRVEGADRLIGTCGEIYGPAPSHPSSSPGTGVGPFESSGIESSTDNNSPTETIAIWKPGLGWRGGLDAIAEEDSQ